MKGISIWKDQRKAHGGVSFERRPHGLQVAEEQQIAQAKTNRPVKA